MTNHLRSSVLESRFGSFSALALILSVAGVGATSLGCSRASAAGGGQPATEGAPFASAPVLPGTPDVATLVARVKPGVVTITSTHEVRNPMLQRGSFGDLFGGGGNGMQRGGGDEVSKQQALGSGFVIDQAGHVITNAHVIEDATDVKVRLSDDREYTAKVKGKDERLDLAVLELQNAPKDIPTVSLGGSEALRVGEYVVAIGNPFGLGNTVTMGIVSAKSRAIGAGPYDDFIQTDASINPGNSGGPLFDLHGQVVGINTAINPNGRGIGFAIPIDAVKDVLPQLLSTGHVARGRIGVAIQPVDSDLARALGLPKSEGALIGDVEKGGPADRAGLVSGDVITSVDTTDVPHAQDLPRIVARHTPGSHVRLTVMHEKQAKSVDVTLAALPESKNASAETSVDTDDDDSAQAPAARPSGLGLQIADSRDPENGNAAVVIARVAPNGPAADALKPGDVILEVNRKPIAGAHDAVAKIHEVKAGDELLFKVMRRGAVRYAAVTAVGGGSQGARGAAQ